MMITRDTQERKETQGSIKETEPQEASAEQDLCNDFDGHTYVELPVTQQPYHKPNRVSVFVLSTSTIKKIEKKEKKNMK